MHQTRLALACAASLGMLLAGCGSSGDGDVPDFPTVVSLGEGDLFPGILNTSLAVGPNRVVMQIIDADDNLVLDAAVHVRYYDLNGDEPRFSSEAEASLISSELSFIDENAGGLRTTTGEGGVYVTHAGFDAPGAWGAEIRIYRGEERTVIPYRFNVLATSEEPGIGDAAPASAQATTATAPIEQIDSSFPFREGMHTTTVADALALGKPAVIAFATPAFCSSRTCGPVLDFAIDPLAIRYDNRVTFIHIEPYRLDDLRQTGRRVPVPAATEWRIQSEPWVFVVGPDGNVAAKFEGLVTSDEIAAALEPLLAPMP